MSKRYIFIITLLIPVLSMGGTGIIRSSDSREPQVIVFEENPQNPDFVMYSFCLTDKKKECISLSNELGVSKELLIAEAKNSQSLEQIMTFLRPTLMLVTVVFLPYLVAQGGLIAFLGGAGSYMLIDWIYSKDYSPELFSEISSFLSPESSGVFVLNLQDMSMLEFSYKLEEKLNEISQSLEQNLEIGIFH